MAPMITLSNAEQAEAYLDRLQRGAAGPGAARRPAPRRGRRRADAGPAPGRRGRRVSSSATCPTPSDPLQQPTLRRRRRVRRERRDAIIADLVRPAYAKYRDVLLSEIAAHGRDADHPGLCLAAGGDAVYAELIKLHTTTDRTADELHQTGLDIIAEAGRGVPRDRRPGLRCSTEQEVFEQLRTDHSLRWTSAAELIDAAKAAIERAQVEAPKWFGRLPSQNCEVRPVPADEAPGAAGAYYMPPALDGSRPGIYLRQHLQRDRARPARLRGDRVPRSRARSPLPAHDRHGARGTAAAAPAPGAERLRRRLGSLHRAAGVARWASTPTMSPSSGMLTLDSMRAARLVVDTGLHAKGWSKQQARAVHAATSPRWCRSRSRARSTATSPTRDRRSRTWSAVWRSCGSAREAEAALGDAFDIRAFHDTVLGSGGLPMGVLDDVVKALGR